MNRSGEQESINIADLGLRIEQCRRAQGLTRDQLAERISISPHYLYEVERGTKAASLSVLVALTVALQTSLDYLILGIDPRQQVNFYKDELDELLKGLDVTQRKNLCRAMRDIIPHLKGVQ